MEESAPAEALASSVPLLHGARPPFYSQSDEKVLLDTDEKEPYLTHTEEKERYHVDENGHYYSDEKQPDFADEKHPREDLLNFTYVEQKHDSGPQLVGFDAILDFDGTHARPAVVEQPTPVTIGVKKKGLYGLSLFVNLIVAAFVLAEIFRPCGGARAYSSSIFVTFMGYFLACGCAISGLLQLLMLFRIAEEEVYNGLRTACLMIQDLPCAMVSALMMFPNPSAVTYVGVVLPLATLTSQALVCILRCRRLCTKSAEEIVKSAVQLVLTVGAVVIVVIALSGALRSISPATRVRTVLSVQGRHIPLNSVASCGPGFGYRVSQSFHVDHNESNLFGIRWKYHYDDNRHCECYSSTVYIISEKFPSSVVKLTYASGHQAGWETKCSKEQKTINHSTWPASALGITTNSLLVETCP